MEGWMDGGYGCLFPVRDLGFGYGAIVGALSSDWRSLFLWSGDHEITDSILKGTLAYSVALYGVLKLTFRAPGCLRCSQSILRRTTVPSF